MRGLKYLLLCAWTAAATWFPAEGEAIIDGRHPYRLKERYYGDKGSMYLEDEVSGALRKRADDVVVNEYCRYWGQSSE